MKSRYYKFWSKIYRFFRQRKYKSVPLERIKSYQYLDSRFDQLTYSADSWKELWDVCSSPNWVQYCLNEIDSENPQPKGPMDCDEFAIWAANVLQGKKKNCTISTQLLSVAYKTKTGKISGHMVCLVECFYPDTGDILYDHVGNWGVYEDYEDIESIVSEICSEHTLIGYSLMDPQTLALKKVRTSYGG